MQLIYLLSICHLLPTKEEVNVFACVRLSVCLWERLLKMHAWIWMKCCMSTDVGTWTNWVTFEPNPDYDPNAGTGLLSSISYTLQCRILLRQENPTYRYRSLQRRVVLEWFYSLWAVGTTSSEVHALHRVPFWLCTRLACRVLFSRVV